MRSVSWLMMMSQDHYFLKVVIMEFSAETSQSLSQWAQTFERWWIFGLFSCRLRRPWPTLADLGISADAVGSPPGVAVGSALFSFSTSSLFIPFSPFPTCLEIASLPPWPGWRWPTTAGSLCLAGRVPKIHVLFLECGLDTNCILTCFCFHSLFFLDDMKPDGFGWLGFVTVWWIWGLPALD